MVSSRHVRAAQAAAAEIEPKKGYRLQGASKVLNGFAAVKVDRSSRWEIPFLSKLLAVTWLSMLFVA